MATLTIVYETKCGQTKKIAERIADIARKRGHVPATSAVQDLDARELDPADAYIILAPVFMGKHPPATRAFVTRHGNTLNEKPSAFVSVSGGAGSTRARDREQAREIAVQLVASTKWRPNLVRTVGGAIAYPRYGFFTRLMMKMISKREGGSTDTSRIHELTDWHAVEDIARELLDFVEPRPAARGATPVVSRSSATGGAT
jgi:menaquinone-dependent protoporphyrinogen oxidase